MQLFKKISTIILIFFCFVKSHSQVNIIVKIDSLTQLFLQGTITKPLPYITTDEVLSLTEQKFYDLVNLLGSAIPFKYDATVVTQMHYMKNPSSSFLTTALNRKNLYFRVFEEVLDKKGMPDEIKYLSIVESLLNANAVSWCGATGLWQFMPATGKMMNLSINSEVDERKDIYKSTEKACDYLLYLHNQFGDWLLALAAYNGGPGNVAKAIRNSGGKRTFWEIKKWLPKETQNYIPKFLSTAFLMSFSPPTIKENSNLLKGYETLVPVILCCEIDMKYICAMVNLSEKEQLDWNSTYKNGFIPEGMENKKVVLPYNKAMKLMEWQDSLYAVSSKSFVPSKYIYNENKTSYHKATKGETVYNIAAKYSVTASQIKQWNRLKSNKLAAGRNLKIYIKSQVVLPIKTDSSVTFLYYVTDNELQTVNDICSQFLEFNLDLTAINNGLKDINTPIGKGKIIKLFFNETI